MHGKSVYRIIMFALSFAILSNASNRKLRDRIDDLLTTENLKYSNVGVYVMDLSNNKRLYSHNADKLFIPASNVKILTAFAALKTLSPRFSFTTTFDTDSITGYSRINNLIIKSNGDHFVNLDELNFQALSLSRLIKRIEGDIIVDNSEFDSLILGKGWMWDDRNPAIAPLSVNNNSVSFTVTPGRHAGDLLSVRSNPSTSFIEFLVRAQTGTEDNLHIERVEREKTDRFIISGSSAGTRFFTYPVSRPGLFAGSLLKDFSQGHGISVDGDVKESGTSVIKLKNIISFSSPSLGVIVSRMMKESNNLSSECILKALGKKENGLPGNADSGITVIKSMLSSMGIKDKSYRIVDGSGLSTYNLLSPQIIVKVLKTIHDDFTIYPEYISALSIGGVDGTLKERLKDSQLVNRFRAKTGTMSGVSCLSGYIQTKKGKMLCFSVMINGFTGSSQPVRDAQDQMVKIMFEEM